MRGEPSARRADANAGHRGEMARLMQVRSGRRVAGRLSGRCEANGGRGTGAVRGAAPYGRITSAGVRSGGIPHAHAHSYIRAPRHRRRVARRGARAAGDRPRGHHRRDGRSRHPERHRERRHDPRPRRRRHDQRPRRRRRPVRQRRQGRDPRQRRRGHHLRRRGADTIEGNAGKDTINGGPGADTLNGNGGADTISGGSGNDVIVTGGDNAADTISCGAGWDVVVAGSNDTVAPNCERTVIVED